MRGPVTCARVLAGFLCLTLGGCAASLESHYRRLRPALAHEDWPLALRLMQAADPSCYGEKNRVLYDLDMAVVLQGAGRYGDSHHYFEAAKDHAKKLYTKSLLTEAWALATSDVHLPYVGEDYERALVHVVDAAGYLAEGRIDEARVEARQMSETLESARRAASNAPEEEHDNAFCHYLAGYLWLSDAAELQALGDAWIEVRRAITLYEADHERNEGATPPSGVIALGLELTARLGLEFAGEHHALAARYPEVTFYPPGATLGRGRVVLLIETGWAPEKVDAFWTVPAGVDIINVAYPRFVETPRQIATARMRPVGSVPFASAELAEDIGLRARVNLAAHMDRIRGRATARAVAQYLAGATAEVVGLERGGGVGALLFVAGSVWNWSRALSAEADKRSWRTLPGALWLGQMWLTPGVREVEVELQDFAGRIVAHRRVQVSVAPGRITFLPVRFYR